MNDRLKYRIFYDNKIVYPNSWNDIESIYECLKQQIMWDCKIDTDIKFDHIDNNLIFMQSTGLKDKNGKLIYEGDILGGIYENLDIFYCPQCMQFELHAKGYGCMCCNGDIHWCEVVEDNNKLEVIGNIYQDSHLLEN